ncbi:TonB-dependent receptor, partial [bacterium]|nr:TonB-dependent receptor [bacterium]
GSSTNDKGYFIIDGVPAGQHRLTATYLGYDEYSKTVVLSEGEELRLDIKLHPSAEVGEEIVVEARREGGEKDLKVGHLILSQKQAKDTPQLLESDIFRTMHLLPGVVSPSDFSSALYIWGGLPSQNLVTLDGIEVYNPTHLGGVFSSFVVDAIKEANLTKGGFPAKWGGRIGSVLEIINIEGNRNKFRGSGEISLLSSHITVQGPLPEFAGPGAWMFSARRTYLDWFVDLVSSMAKEEAYFPYHFTDIHTKITRDFESGDKFSITYYRGADVFNFDEGQDSTDDFVWDWGNNTISANYTHLFSPKYFGHFTAAYSQFSEKLAFGSSETARDYVKDFTLRGMLSTAYARHIFETGLEFKYLSVLNQIEDPDYYEPWWDWKNDAALISLYAQDEWKPNPLWQIQYGLRSEYCSSDNFFKFSPRFSAMRVLDTKTRVKFATGLYYQYFQSVPKFEELGLSFFETWTLAQEGLEPSWATHFVLRGETEHLWNLPISVDVYFKRMGNLWRHQALYNPSDTFANMFEIGDGWASGIDFLTRFNGKKWAGWISYSLSYAVNSFPSINSGEPFYTKYDRRHDISIYLARDLGGGYTFSSAWLLHTGVPYTEPIGIYQVPDNPDEPSYWEECYYFGGYHNKHAPFYHRLDLSIAHRTAHSWGDLEWYFQVLNVYCAHNINSYIYFSGGDKEEIPELAIPIPSFGVRAWF